MPGTKYNVKSQSFTIQFGIIVMLTLILFIDQVRALILLSVIVSSHPPNYGGGGVSCPPFVFHVIVIVIDETWYFVGILLFCL